MTADSSDDERIARLVKRVRPRRDDSQGEQTTERRDRWRPLKRRGRRTFTTEIDRDGAMLIREID